MWYQCNKTIYLCVCVSFWVFRKILILTRGRLLWRSMPDHNHFRRVRSWWLLSSRAVWPILFVKMCQKQRKHSEKGSFNKGTIFNTSSREKLAADVSAVVCDMFSNGAMWSVRLFPGFGDATIKKSWPLTNPSTTIPWFCPIYLKPCLKASFLRPAGVKSLCERSFPTLPWLQSQRVPSQGIAWIEFPEKLKPFLIGYPQRHTSNQKK